MSADGLPETVDLDRRSFLATSGAVLTGASMAGAAGADSVQRRSRRMQGERLSSLEFYFANGLLDDSFTPGLDEKYVAVRSEPTASIVDALSPGSTYNAPPRFDGTLVEYPDDEGIPLVAIDQESVEGDGVVAGCGGLPVRQGFDWERHGNAEFMLNLLDETIGRPPDGDATVLYHEYGVQPAPAGQRPETVDQQRQYKDDQYYGLERIEAFVEYAEERSYEFISDTRTPEVGDPNKRNEQFVATLEAENPDAVMLVAPNRFDQPELEVLRRYVRSGGTLLLIDQSDFVVEEVDLTQGALGYGDIDETPDPSESPAELIRTDENQSRETQRDASTTLNRIADYLGAAFRFNDGAVADRPNSRAGAAVTPGSGSANRGETGDDAREAVEIGTAGEKIFFTGQFNTSRFPQLFDDRDGLDGSDQFFRYRAPVDSIIDGDSMALKFVSEGDGSFDTRQLGIDTPEDGGDQPFERPVEWEGRADGGSSLPIMDVKNSNLRAYLQFEQACSLLDVGRRRIAADDDDIAVYTEEPAGNRAPGDGSGFVDYGDGPIPLVGVDDNAVALGSLLVDGSAADTVDNYSEGQGEPPENTVQERSIPSFDLLLNIWDDQTGGGKTVLYDQSHGQPPLADKYSPFKDYATRLEDENNPGSDPDSRLAAAYTLEPTDDLTADLGKAAAVWITPPEEPFSGQEIARLRQFMNDGGSVFIHGRAATGEDAFTDNLNQLARRLGIRFRFNADEVIDPERSDFKSYLRTGNFNRDFPFFLLRQCGVNKDYGSPQFAAPGLRFWGGIAGLSGAAGLVFEDRVTELELDPNSAAFDGLGRPLGYLYFDRDNDGELDTNFNKWMIEQGLARVYDGSNSKHDEFLKAELRAKEENRGIWRESEPIESDPIRNRPVEELYVPQATAVRSDRGRLPRSRAPVLAEPTASEPEAPLVGLDRSRNLAMVGGPMPAESYEIREDDFRSIFFVSDIDPFQVNTAGYENYVFLANVLLALSQRDGDVYIDGGHYQFGGSVDRFGANYNLSAEDSRYFDRFLEGVNVGYHGINDIPANLLDGMDGLAPSRALVITTPRTPFTDAEVETVREFIDRGGAVMLMGSAEAPAEETGYLNDLAARLGTDLRLDGAPVRDETNNLRGQARLPTTSNLNPRFERLGLFDEVEPRPVEREIDTRTTVNAKASRSAPEFATEGQMFRVDVTVENVDRPVKIRDEVEGFGLRNSKIYEEKGDVTHVEMGGRGGGLPPLLNYVELGEVTPEDVKGDRTVTRSYFMEYRINERFLTNPLKTKDIAESLVSLETGPTIAAFYAGPENGYVNEVQFEGAEKTTTTVRPRGDPSKVTPDGTSDQTQGSPAPAVPDDDPAPQLPDGDSPLGGL